MLDILGIQLSALAYIAFESIFVYIMSTVESSLQYIETVLYIITQQGVEALE